MTRPYASTVLPAITQLVALIEAAVAAQGLDVLVRDGLWTSAETARDVICVGWPGFQPGYQRPTQSMSEDEGSAAVTFTTVMQGLGPVLAEQMEINCAVIARSGSAKDPVTKARAAAYQYVDLVGSVIQPPWLNGVIKKATMGASGALHYAPGRQGYDAILTFSVECEAWSQ